MARITVEDCLARVNNRFLIVQMALNRVKQYREGYDPLVDSSNKEIVTALREIAAGKVMPANELADVIVEEELEDEIASESGQTDAEKEKA